MANSSRRINIFSTARNIDQTLQQLYGDRFSLGLMPLFGPQITSFIIILPSNLVILILACVIWTGVRYCGNLIRFDVTTWNEGEAVSRDKFIELVKGRDAIVTSGNRVATRIDGPLLDEIGPQLKVISSISVGMEYIDVEATRKRGIRVGYLPRVQNKVVAEMAIALLLSFDRGIVRGKDIIESDEWRKNLYRADWNCGIGLDGSVVGIIGLGAIGLEIARALKPFGVRKIIYHGKSGRKSQGDDIGAEFSTFEDLLAESQFVIISCPLTDETKFLFNKEAFSAMRKDALLVNISRGEIVDQDELVKALENNRIRGAALDVMTPEPLPGNHILAKLPNCILTPHVAWYTKKSKERMWRITAENLVNGLEGKTMYAEL